MTEAEYLRRLRQALRAMPAAERDRLVQEIESHLTDRAEAGAAEAAMTALGEPERLARSFLDDYSTARAVERGGPARLLVALLLRGARSVLAAVVGAAALMLYTVGGLSLILAFLKISRPAYVGVWSQSKGHVSLALRGLGKGEPPPDILGWWLLVILIVLTLASSLAAGALMRHGARRLLAGPRLGVGA